MKTVVITSPSEIVAVETAVINTVDVVGTGNGVIEVKSEGPQGPRGPTGLGIDDGDKGDLTVSNTAVTWTINPEAVTYAKIQNVSGEDKLLGRVSSGAGPIEEISCTAAGRALLDDADAAAQRTTLGLGGLATETAAITTPATGDLLVRDSSGAWVNKTAQQVSQGGTWLNGVAVTFSSLSGKDLIQYNGGAQVWENVPAQSLVDGGNF